MRFSRKTRLALQVGAELLDAFVDGVFFVDLAPLADPTLVPSAVAQALGVHGFTDRSVRESVLRFLRDQRLLLVLDNYEHLLAAAEFVAALLQVAPLVSLLVTSRAPLRVPGEREYAVPPLPLAEAGAASVAAVEHNPAVALFVQRAQGVRPDFALSGENAAAVAAVCSKLDGLPLAIELAAARVRTLPPPALLARLGQRLPLLTAGARTAPAWQQTLRGAMTWSYDLLEPAEQRLFRRLAVFAGGCTVALAEAVCSSADDLGLDVLDGVSSLVEKSLLRVGEGVAGEPRYRMLETIREFALGELETSGEAEDLRRQLAVQVLQLVQTCAAASDWPRLDADLDNARAVLGWCVDRAELGVGVRLLLAPGLYLFTRGLVKEVEVWRQRLLALPEAAQPSRWRARLLAHAPFEFLTTAEQEPAAAELVEAIGLSRALDDTRCLADALRRLARLRTLQGHPGAAVPLATEALALHLAAGAVDRAILARGILITAAVARGDLAAADALVAANRALVGPRTPGMYLEEAQLAEARGDDAQARVLFAEAVRRLGADQGEQGPGRLAGLWYLAHVLLRQGDTAAAVAICAESLAVHRNLGPSLFLTPVLQVLAQAAERCGRLADSTRLLAVVDVQMRAHVGVTLGSLPVEQAAGVERVQAALDAAAFAEAWAAGEALSADAAIAFGLDVVAQLQQVLATDTDAVKQET